MLLLKNCLRCAHQWFSRTPHEPKRCPKCRSILWRTQKKRQDATDAPKDKLNKDKRRWTFHDLEVGESEQWEFTTISPQDANRRVRALEAFKRRTGRVFYWDANKWTITRVK